MKVSEIPNPINSSEHLVTGVCFLHPFADLDDIRLDPGLMSWRNMIYLDQV